MSGNIDYTSEPPNAPGRRREASDHVMTDVVTGSSSGRMPTVSSAHRATRLPASLPTWARRSTPLN